MRRSIKLLLTRLTLIATSLGFALIILDVTVVNVALERIKTSLDTDVSGLQWVVNAYTLVFASLLLTKPALRQRTLCFEADFHRWLCAVHGHISSSAVWREHRDPYRWPYRARRRGSALRSSLACTRERQFPGRRCARPGGEYLGWGGWPGAGGRSGRRRRDGRSLRLAEHLLPQPATRPAGVGAHAGLRTFGPADTRPGPGPWRTSVSHHRPWRTYFRIRREWPTRLDASACQPCGALGDLHRGWRVVPADGSAQCRSDATAIVVSRAGGRRRLPGRAASPISPIMV